MKHFSEHQFLFVWKIYFGLWNYAGFQSCISHIQWTWDIYLISPIPSWSFLVAQSVKNPPAMQETQIQSLCQEDPLGEKMATYSSILAWRIPWREEPGRLQSRGHKKSITTELLPPPVPQFHLDPSHVRLCNPMGCSTLVFPVPYHLSWSLPKFMSIE